MKPNPGKNLKITVDGKSYLRIPIKTSIIKKGDSLKEILEKFVKPHLQKGDVIFISEKVVAIVQGRAIKVKDIKPSFWAKFLSRFVYKNPYGIGIAIPETMELAINEVGLFRILLAGFFSVLTKFFGIKGVFYLIAGRRVAAIDGPVPYALPPYNEYAILAPLNPKEIAQKLSDFINYPCAIIDANDLGVEILAFTIPSNFEQYNATKIDKQTLKKALKDNPLGQSSEQTPIGILRYEAIDV